MNIYDDDELADYFARPRVGDSLRVVVRKFPSPSNWAYRIQAANGTRSIGQGYETQQDALYCGLAKLKVLRG